MEDLEFTADLSLLKVEEEIQKAEQALRLDFERFGRDEEQLPSQSQPQSVAAPAPPPPPHQQQKKQQEQQQQRVNIDIPPPPSYSSHPAAGEVPPGARMSVSLSFPPNFL
jgi:hypothetical protein